jgi:hypothetical protein
MTPKRAATRHGRPASPPAPRRGDADWKIRVRMYRHGLGDCFLLSFNGASGRAHALIDCGVLRTSGDVTLDDVVADIRKETERHLDVVVATHEHSDHVSGFRTHKKAFTDNFQIDHAWVAWTEDPDDGVAQDLQKYQDDLLEAVRLAATDEVLPLLAFYGERLGGTGLKKDLKKTVNEAMDFVTSCAGSGRDFLLPGRVLEPGWLPGIRVYVLGPPRDTKAIGRAGGHGDAELYELSLQPGAFAATARFLAAGGGARAYAASLTPAEREALEGTFPFDPRFRVECPDKGLRPELARYTDPSAAWRRIDGDWAAAASDLALQLDTNTNNTSLVLAFELIEDGRVLLFPGDAQVGNWLSWHDNAMTWKVKGPGGEVREVTARSLLERTVFYKVGHHGSHNATVTQLGLELMTHSELVAFIPVDRQCALAQRPHPWLMPADGLYRRLLERTRGRTLRSDSGWSEKDERPKSVTKERWDEARATASVVESRVAIDYLLR